MTARQHWPMPEDLGRRREPAVLRAAWWALWAYRSVRRQLARTGLEAVVPTPPRLPRRAGRGVDAVLHRHSATCLERCLVLQRWLMSQGEVHDVVIGVARPDDEFTAHAWLDFETGTAADLGYAEIHRISAPA